MLSWLALFKPAPHIALLPKDQVDPLYKRLRLQVFLSIFIGYVGYYLLRNNIALAMPYLWREGFTPADLGLVSSGVPIAYGFSKFFMGNVSDRSNPRYFLAAGLLLSAILNFIFGLVPGVAGSLVAMFAVLLLNGWVQGMGWPPCGRTMVHWYSVGERGLWVSIWNVAHNVGGGLVGPLAIVAISLFGVWQSIFYFPAMIALLIVAFVLWGMRDTPQSVGLPPIEVYHDEYPADELVEDREKEMSARDIFFKYVLRNKFLWYIAIANIFISLVRYGVVNWAPTYLSVVKGFDRDETSWAYFLYEYAGIPGTLLCGYLSDKLYSGRRAPIGIIYMVLVLIAILFYWLTPGTQTWVYDAALIMIGFLIYGPVMLIGLFALDLAPKKAAGTAVGLTGMFGYVGGAVLANLGMGFVVQYFGWSGGFMMLVAACVLSIFFLALTLGQHSPLHRKQ